MAAHPSLLLSNIPHLDYPTIHTSIIQLVGIRVVCIWGLSEQHGSEHSGTRVPCILENVARHPEVALCVFTSGHTAKFSPHTALGVFLECARRIPMEKYKSVLLRRGAQSGDPPSAFLKWTG